MNTTDKMERREMTIEEAIICLKCVQKMERGKNFQKCLDMAIRSLKIQKELAEYSGMYICQFIEDYDYEETDISEYSYEDSVDNFLIDEVKEEGKEE